MYCDDVRKNLSAYLDGELDTATADAVSAHLSKCADCLSELEQLKTIALLMQEVSEAEPPSALASSIMQAAAEDTNSEDCGTCRAMLSPYIDGELSAAEESLVRIHLALCSSCSKEAAALSMLSSAVTSIEEAEPPSDLRERIAAVTTRRKSILASIRSLFQQPSIISRRPVWTAAGVIALALGIWLISPHAVQKTTDINISPSSSSPKTYVLSETPKPAPEPKTSVSDNKTPERRTFTSTSNRQRTHIALQKTTAPAVAAPHAPNIAELPTKEAETNKPEPPSETGSNVSAENNSTTVAETVEPSTPTEQARPKLIKIVVQPVPKQEDLERIMREVKASAEMRYNESDKVKMDVITKRF